MVAGNSINESTTGICGFTGTAFTGTPVTAHDVLIGGATSSTIAQAAPSATSGIPLVSNGASADPSFTTAVVAGGGTGDTSFTAYSVITGGTTSTGVLQNVSGVGTSGQVLTSNGASALPSWQNALAPPANSTLTVQDDFLAYINPIGTYGISNYGWSGSNNPSFTQATTTENGHPGIISNAAFSASNVSVSMINSANSLVLGGGAITVNWVFKIVNLSDSSNRYTLRLGLGDTTGGDMANGCYLEYSDNINSGNWNFKTASGSTRTTSNSITAVTTGWHNAQISINAAATSVAFTMDGVSLGTAIATNIPTTAVSLTFDAARSGGTIAAGSLLVDLVYMTQTLTNAR